MPAVLLHPRYCFVSTGATYALATEVLKTEAGQMAAARSYNVVAGESELPGQCVILELKIQFCQYFICCLTGCVSLLHSRNVAWCSVSSNFPGNQVGLCPGIGRKWKWSSWEYRFLKVVFIPTQIQILMKSHLIGTGYQYSREHWYDMDLEEAETPEFSCICISPLANLLYFS